jgi:hypothetical protein
VVDSQALCTGYCLDAGIDSSGVAAEEAATHGAILGAIIDNEDNQEGLYCHTAFFLPLSFVEAYITSECNSNG